MNLNSKIKQMIIIMIMIIKMRKIKINKKIIKMIILIKIKKIEKKRKKRKLYNKVI